MTYTLSSENDVTLLSATQGPFRDKEAYDHAGASWDIALSGLKTVLEKNLSKFKEILNSTISLPGKNK